MESQPKNPEFRKNPENFLRCICLMIQQNSIRRYRKSKQQAFIHLWKFRANSNILLILFLASWKTHRPKNQCYRNCKSVIKLETRGRVMDLVTIQLLYTRPSYKTWNGKDGKGHATYTPLSQTGSTLERTNLAPFAR